MYPGTLKIRKLSVNIFNYFLRIFLKRGVGSSTEKPQINPLKKTFVCVTPPTPLLDKGQEDHVALEPGRELEDEGQGYEQRQRQQ